MSIPQWQIDVNKEANYYVCLELAEIDAKSIRALRTNDTARLATLEAEAATLRAQLLPEA